MIPLTPHGWREMLIGSVILAILAAGLADIYPPLALIVLPFWVWLFAFFRDPERGVPAERNVVVSPADGTVSDIVDIEHDETLGGPAVRVGIFLSVFNVHVNRCPCNGKVLSVHYKRGKFINAMSHGEASEQNESNTIVLTATGSDKPIIVVRQIVGLIARRIICTVGPGQALRRGQRIGMIKFGSRTELTIARSLEPQIQVQVGQKVRGAASVMALLGNPVTPAVPEAAAALEPMVPRETSA
jgi:phosphatidylserine decarboxylase